MALSQFDVIMQDTVVPALMTVFGVAATYYSEDALEGPGTEVTVALETMEVGVGIYGEITEFRTVAMFDRQEVSEPVRGDRLVVDDRTYVVDGIIFPRSDAYTITVALRDGIPDPDELLWDNNSTVLTWD